MDDSILIYDWNVSGGRQFPPRPAIELDDETLRDGLQSPSVRSPSVDEKLHILHCIADLGIEAANIGLPGASPQVKRDVLVLAREIRDCALPITPNCAARTVRVDIDPIVDVAMVAGIPVEAAVFIGSSPIRQYAEGWTVEGMVQQSIDAVTYARNQGLPVMYVTEDTTRASPDTLRRLYTAAIEAGANRICLADTVGYATPEGVWNLVRFARDLVTAMGGAVGIDWHGHNDRGLGLINALTAISAGVDRVHGTALGIGERVGNTPIDQLLVNLKVMGWIERDLSRLGSYCDFVGQVTGVTIPANYPVFGRDAFRTGTGVHAAAIIKAKRKGDDWLANRVYSGVPADYFGRSQIIEVGPMSGKSNIVYWLETRGFAAMPALVDSIFLACKDASCLLAEEEIINIVTSWQAMEPTAGSRKGE